MRLGNFSNSLAVKDIKKSISFYSKLGFEMFHDQSEHNWVIMKNEDTVIGLFQGMFESNIMTFNPGWDRNGANVDPFDDVRSIQKSLRQQGISFETEVDESSEGPGSLVISDPDGNLIMLDQHR